MNDLISREDAIKAVTKLCEHYTSTKSVTHPHIDFVIEEINAIPVADPVKRGRWIYGQDFKWYTAHCSLCGYGRSTDVKTKKWNMWGYCPNCGAKMDGEGMSNEV